MKGDLSWESDLIHSDYSKPTAVDLFCGCGGLTVGLKIAGFKVLGALDIDPLAARTYKENHKEVTLWEKDIRELKPEEMLNVLGLKRGELDLLAGCPPCQGFSTLRTMNGAIKVEDPQNDLLMEFERFVEVILPRTIMIENVPGLANDKLFAIFCSRLETFGYNGHHAVLNAADYGVPQRRRRLIYLAGIKREIPFGEKKRRRKTVKDAIGGMPKAGQSGDPLHDMPERRTPKVLELISLIPKNGGSRKDLPEKFQLECHKRCNGFKDVYGRMAWDSVAPTITSGCFNPSKGRFLHPEENRAITMREAALLQGFPLLYKFPTTNNKSAIALMIGNALPPPFIAAHGKSIKRVLKVRDKV
ncbi:DNA cytosine methyltransferase [Dethiosulfovibrio marinus]|uniref:Cytosine-specific methyltransferase n=3 Tax=Dethiosulfovibrionaceae TaxID=3029088 RepID=A0ABS9EMC6_9BACT|nr:DNA cytosine methyltransferase [Dethiosulfovibrio marinus]MCF4141864.1 DNA cytosine methyltransferase [Dethiosulfovibrio marinus]MCF4143718.1 DNA cytosine methyltransferase [Dethiosulfovibrio acidaminovorans]